MSKRSFIPSDDIGDITVYIGAHVPPRLYQLMVEEATQADLSHSKMIGRILAERYREQGDKGKSNVKAKMVRSQSRQPRWALPGCQVWSPR